MAAATRALRRTYSVQAELAVVALVILAWQAVRIPLEGGVAVSLGHAAEVIRLERALSIDVERSIIDFASSSNVEAVLAWLYKNAHLPVLFGFMAAARLLAPARYPMVRTTFVLSFLPAVLVIGLYPLAPPHWLPQFGLGVPPSDAELAGTTGAIFHNVTAAAASQHFGFSAFVAATAIWLFPRAPLAWCALAYPVVVFVVIVGTGNHYVLDCVVGTLTFAFAAVVAWLFHGPPPPETVGMAASDVASIAFGYALLTWGFVSLELTVRGGWYIAPEAVVLIAGIAFVVAPQLGAKEALAETSY